MITYHLDILDGKLLQVVFKDDDDLFRMTRFMREAKKAIERMNAEKEAKHRPDFLAKGMEE